MIEFKTGDILKEQAEALVNTVNCVGIMGRGIALQFKKAYPQNYKAYAAACKQHKVQPGEMFIVEISQLTNPKYIINFPTKRHWRGKSRIEDIDAGLKALVSDVRNLGIQSIAIPPLGCGLGGLNWNTVKPAIIRAFSELENVKVFVFEPAGAPNAQDMKASSEIPKMTPGRAALVGLIDEYLKALMDPVVTLLEIHKLMYFMQEAGQPLKLNYSKAPFGPFASNLGHVLDHLEGHLLSGYADGGDAPDKEIKLIPGAVKDASEVLSTAQETVERFKRVVDLVEGFETPFGMELLSTVHWVVAKEGAKSLDEAISAIYGWNARKQQFSRHQVEITYKRLLAKGWLKTD